MSSLITVVKDPNAPADRLILETAGGTRVGVPRVKVAQLQKDLAMAASTNRDLDYIQYVRREPWATLVFPLLLAENPEWQNYTNYDEDCSQAIEEIAIKLITQGRK